MSSPPSVFSSHPASTLPDESTSLSRSPPAEHYFPSRPRGSFLRSYTAQDGHENIRVRAPAPDDHYGQDPFVDEHEAAHELLGNDDAAGAALGVEGGENAERRKPFWMAKNQNSKIR